MGDNHMMDYDLYASIRDARGLKDVDVANRGHISKTTLSEWKHGRSTPKYDKMDAIAEVLDCSIDQLLGRVPLVEFVVSDNERQLILDYRKADEVTRHAIERLLRLDSIKKE